MKTILRSAFVITTLAATLSAAPQPADPAAELLRRHGSVPVAQAGPYVEVGSFLIQVSAKLGRPDHVLPDGTWLYRGRRIEGSDARGALVVRFTAARVSSLALATDAVVVALRANPAHPVAAGLVATK